MSRNIGGSWGDPENRPDFRLFLQLLPILNFHLLLILETAGTSQSKVPAYWIPRLFDLPTKLSSLVCLDADGWINKVANMQLLSPK